MSTVNLFPKSVSAVLQVRFRGVGFRFCNSIDNNHWGFPYFLLFDKRVIAFADTVRYNTYGRGNRIPSNFDGNWYCGEPGRQKKKSKLLRSSVAQIKKKLYFGGKKSLNSA